MNFICFGQNPPSTPPMGVTEPRVPHWGGGRVVGSSEEGRSCPRPLVLSSIRAIPLSWVFVWLEVSFRCKIYMKHTHLCYTSLGPETAHTCAGQPLPDVECLRHHPGGPVSPPPVYPAIIPTTGQSACVRRHTNGTTQDTRPVVSGFFPQRFCNLFLVCIGQ